MKTPTLQTIIGLEIHVQLKTASKMFCSCLSDTENSKPNTNVCPICLGHPGILPIINQKAVDSGYLIALALNCRLNNEIHFARKNYFYPDLPKGYQISQHSLPIASNGYLKVPSPDSKFSISTFKVTIERVHLEEDTAKLFHPTGTSSLADYNRAGIPLAEIVTLPVIPTPAHARRFLQELQLTLRALGVSDADMEKGQLRCDANISLRPKGDPKYYPKTEVKNLNSFRSLERALEYEVLRQTALWQEGLAPTVSATVSWDENAGRTIIQRSKETLGDYRYFPEPDLPPFKISPSYLKQLKAISLPELPTAQRQRWFAEYGLKGEIVDFYLSNPEWSQYWENLISEIQSFDISAAPASETTSDETKNYRSSRTLGQIIATWLVNHLKPALEKNNLSPSKIPTSSDQISELIALNLSGRIKKNLALETLDLMLKNSITFDSALEKIRSSRSSSEFDLDDLARRFVSENPDQVAAYRAGKTAILQYFIGLIMRATKGSADPESVQSALKKALTDLSASL